MERTAGPGLSGRGENSTIARSNLGCGWICRIR